MPGSRLLIASRVRTACGAALLCVCPVPSLPAQEVQPVEKPATTESTAEVSVEELTPEKKVDSTKEKATEAWQNLLPEKGLGDWIVSDFVGSGKVEWDGKVLTLESGNPMTGINYTKKDFPTGNYEIQLYAKRVDGSDFFCCLTFPIDDQHCSFVAGGWGGGTTGLSSVGGSDASENETSSYQEFETDRWYKVRLQVTKAAVKVWIDDESVVDLDREYAKFDTRIEVWTQQPLGLCSYMTKAAIKDFQWRAIDDAGKPILKNSDSNEKPQAETRRKKGPLTTDASK